MQRAPALCGVWGRAGFYKNIYVKIWPNNFDRLVSQSHALSLYYCLPHPSMAQANYVHVSVDSSLLARVDFALQTVF